MTLNDNITLVSSGDLCANIRVHVAFSRSLVPAESY